jgi:hypothetical protein
VCVCEREREREDVYGIKGGKKGVKVNIYIYIYIYINDIKKIKEIYCVVYLNKELKSNLIP